MGHPGTGAMGKDKARARLRGPRQERGDRSRLPNLDAELLGASGFHATIEAAGVSGDTSKSHVLATDANGLQDFLSRPKAGACRLQNCLRSVIVSVAASATIGARVVTRGVVLC
jgi:hypothetical protein